MSGSGPASAARLRAAFESARDHLVGIEDEVMLLAPDSFALVDRAPEVLAMLDGDPRFKLELPASQLEIITEPVWSAGEAAAALLEGRRALAERVGEVVRCAGAGVHPFSPGVGELNSSSRYEHVIRQYGPIARRQLVCALQVHVAVAGGERSLAVYNAARSYLPLLAALAANAPYYEGQDSGLASVRPKLGELLPRQGIPPAIASWEDYAEMLRWGAASGAFPDARTWWWELRLHPGFGTLEFRVPDAQSTVADAAAIVALTQALVAWLAERHDRGERLRVDPSWRIEENRWSACRHGVEGGMADLDSGESRPTRAWLSELISTLEAHAERFHARAELGHARELVECNGALAQRRVAADGGPQAVAPWLAGRFLAQ